MLYGNLPLFKLVIIDDNVYNVYVVKCVHLFRRQRTNDVNST